MNANKQPADRSKRKWRGLEKLIYPIALLTAVLGCVYCYWTTTPSYALANIVLAVQNHDAQTFEKYIDIDSVTGSAFDDLLSGPARHIVTGHISGPMVFLGIDFLRFFRTDVVDIAHDQVVRFVSDRSVKVDIGHGALTPIAAATAPLRSAMIDAPTSGESRQLAQKIETVDTSDSCPSDNPSKPDRRSLNQRNTTACPRKKDNNKAIAFIAKTVSRAQAQVSVPAETEADLVQTPHLNDRIKRQLREFGLSKSGFRGMKYFDVDGSNAVFGLEFYSPKLHETWVAEFKMEDCGGYWRVTEMSNLNQLVDKYIALRDTQQI